MKHFLWSLIVLLFINSTVVKGQDSTAYQWEVSGKKVQDKVYELTFTTTGNPKWQLYGVNEVISDVPAAELELADSSIQITRPFKETGDNKAFKNPIFDNASFKIYEGKAAFTATVTFTGDVPAKLLGTFRYTYGKGDEFYPLNACAFSVPLEGGVAATNDILVKSFDLKHPVSGCGDENTGGKGMLSIFFLGMLGGFIALFTPCVFPLIPLTVSFFTKQSKDKKKGVSNAIMYGFSIFLIYILLSIPFHLVSGVNPEILNNISTNIWLNITFFLIFVFFAISFFGYFEIGLPSGLANKIDSKSGMSSLGGIFFMAMTLAIVSFSCTGPILGSLLAGTAAEGAWPLTVGLAGFGLALALPFALFAMFPGWLQSLPKAGGWLGSVKVVLGFLELAMAVKFLSNADLVKQWGILKREVFIGIWVIVGICIVLYLLGKIKFPHDSPVKKFSKTRIAFIVLFSAATLYVIPGLTNTHSANLGLISGFPPPLCYSLYKNPVNCEKGIEPLRNDYQEALARAKKENKPVLIDFTGWACVNCRRMEENVWTDEKVGELIKDKFIIVSLYVDERRTLPATQQVDFTTKTGSQKKIITVGDKWATFQSENFDAVAQPQYAIISPDQKILTKTKGYTPSAKEFAQWLECGVDAYKKGQGTASK
ncbi:cytochrome C biogenesis protein [Niastella yeongjuensis]|uniref:Cytochrome C biogenesis protein n=1 Tax=Niastella yeongjuensis TaxID=354355 RepID=A0A1V9ENU0_9BACT|nr:thioredoxin family protein [Niastella yeongjuensis]OQP47797.1 cytochrome C biogenesis protein [Niastella yeongjuensis]SEP45203.1 thiol:disulfide interchange protein DsbD [Niastella yeongjuensis]